MGAPGTTPGPWVWRDDQVPSDQWSLAPGVLIADGTDGTPGGDEIDRANAHQIAASGDLYDALKAAERAIQCAYMQADAEHRDNDKAADRHDAEIRAWRTVRDAALAKAEGR